MFGSQCRTVRMGPFSSAKRCSGPHQPYRHGTSPRIPAAPIPRQSAGLPAIASEAAETRGQTCAGVCPDFRWRRAARLSMDDAGGAPGERGGGAPDAAGGGEGVSGVGADEALEEFTGPVAEGAGWVVGRAARGCGRTPWTRCTGEGGRSRGCGGGWRSTGCRRSGPAPCRWRCAPPSCWKPTTTRTSAIEPAPPGSAFRLLWKNTHRWRVMSAMGQRLAHFRTITATARRVPVARMTRPRYPFLLDALGGPLSRRIRARQDRPRSIAVFSRGVRSSN